VDWSICTTTPKIREYHSCVYVTPYGTEYKKPFQMWFHNGKVILSNSMTNIILICNPLFNYHISFSVFAQRSSPSNYQSVFQYKNYRNFILQVLTKHCGATLKLSYKWHHISRIYVVMNKCELAQHDIYSTRVKMKMFCLIIITNGKKCDIIWYWSPQQKTTKNAYRISIFWYFNLPLESCFELTVIKSCDMEDSWSFW